MDKQDKIVIDYEGYAKVMLAGQVKVPKEMYENAIENDNFEELDKYIADMADHNDIQDWGFFEIDTITPKGE